MLQRKWKKIRGMGISTEVLHFYVGWSRDAFLMLFLNNDPKAIREWVGPPCAVAQVKHCFSFQIAIYMYYVKNLTTMLALIGGSHVDVKGKRSWGKSTSYARVLRLEGSWHVQGTEWVWARVLDDSKEASGSQLFQGPVTTVGLGLLPWVIWEKGNWYNLT